MVLGGISQSVKSQLIVIAGNLTAVRYRDEVLSLLCSNVRSSRKHAYIILTPLNPTFI